MTTTQFINQVIQSNQALGDIFNKVFQTGMYNFRTGKDANTLNAYHPTVASMARKLHRQITRWLSGFRLAGEFRWPIAAVDYGS